MAEQTLSKLAKDIWPHLIHRVEAATKHGRGGSGTTGGGGGSDLTAHVNRDYIEAHDTSDPAVNRNGTYYSYNFGITGGISTDEANNLTLMFDAVGAAGGGTIIVRSANGTDPIYLSKLATLGYSNVNVIFRSPVVYGADGGLRIMGELSLTAPRPGNLSCNLASNSYEDVNGRTVLPLRPGHGAFLSVGQTIVIRGLNDITGKAVQRDISVIYSIVGDLVTCVDELEYTFQDTYTATDSPITSSDWGPDASTGTTIYIWDGSLFTGNITAGAMTVVVADASVFSVGDLVIVRDNRTEWDMNNSAIRSSLLPYRNAANQEMAKVLAVDTGTDTVTLDHALTRSYLTANYGGLFVILPVENSSISGARITYIADQVTRSSHSLQIFYAENCHVFDNVIDGMGGRRGQAVRISTSYQCSAYRNVVDGAKFTDSGDGYGISVYNGATFTRIYSNTVIGCRHSILLQCATHTAIYDNESRDDKISGIDLHGVLSIGTHIFGNFITRSNGNTTDSSNGSGIRIGNTSHTCGDLDTTVEDNFIIGYFTGDGTESAIDFIPASKGLVLRNNTLVDCSDGIRFTRNSSHITPTQTAENISIEGNTLRRCAVPFNIDGASTGFISKLTVKGNISDQNSKHFVFIDVLVALNCCDNIIINPVAATGEYGYSFLRVDGLLCDNNRAHKANKGIYLKNSVSAVITNNILTATIDVVPFLDDGGNTSLIYVNNIDANVSTSDEAAQDAVGTILVDTATIDFTYTDATPSITASVIDGSITATKLADGAALAEILDDDGAGSLLDADLLDGVQGSGYALAVHTHASTDTTDFTEAAQDAAGAALVDTATINLTYTDATPAITADVIDGSITSTKLADGAALAEILDDDGAGSLLDADLLDGVQGSGYALATHAHAGEDITSGTVADVRIAATITRDSEVFGIVLAADGAGSTLDADTLDALNSTAFLILAGQAGGQTAKGDTASAGNLTLMSTNHATKGKILFGISAYDEVNDWLGIGIATPTSPLHVHSTGDATPVLIQGDQTTLIVDLFNNTAQSASNEMRLDYSLNSTTQKRTAVRETAGYISTTDATRTTYWRVATALSGTFANRLFLSGKSLGINIEPAYVFHLKNSPSTNAAIEYDDSTSGYGEFTFRDATSGNAKWGFGVAADSYTTAALQNAFYIFQYRNAAETATNIYPFVITNAGNVGIGMNAVAATAKLQVAGGIAITDGMTAPAAITGYGQIFIDSADGDLKIIYSNGVVKTIVIDT